MNKITIRNQEVMFNVMDELEPYLDRFGKYVIRGEKLISQSPFRTDRKPSFALNLETLCFIDSGATDEYYKGFFTQLLAFLRNETVQDTCEYLISKYGYVSRYADIEGLKLSINLIPEEENNRIFTLDELKQYYKYKTNYLTNRGISEKCQRAFKICCDKDNKAVGIPWFDIDGNIINVKFRSVNSKSFFHLKGGQLLRNHVYGLHMVRRMKVKEIVIVEAEIDCLYLWSNGIPSVAMGHGALSEGQLKLLRRSGVERIVCGGDSDRVGERFNRQMAEELLGMFDLYSVKILDGRKDWNDLTPKEVTLVFENRQKLGLKIAI